MVNSTDTPSGAAPKPDLADLRPEGYSSRVRVSLEPDSDAADATRVVLLSLFETMVVNEEGTRRDLDPEFLHDFRVAVRRTRSALSQLKKVFDRDLVRPFTKEFSWLGKLTGPTRDLDVYLIKLAEYAEPLPEGARSSLAPLDELLQRRQRAEQSLIRRGLESQRYRDLKAGWREFLVGSDGRDDGKDARKPALKVASHCIRRAHRRVLRKGSAITPESRPEKLHRLRIDGKKLRYLLEFFRSLYPIEEIVTLVSSLKHLQDNLGDFNDYGVHQEMLRDLAEELSSRGAPAETLAAIARLGEELERGRETERQAFADRFVQFTSPATSAKFKELFG